MRSYFAAFALATTAMLGISAANAVPITVYSNNFDGVVTGTGVVSGAANSIESHQALPSPFSGALPLPLLVPFPFPAFLAFLFLLALPALLAAPLGGVFRFFEFRDTWEVSFFEGGGA